MSFQEFIRKLNKKSQHFNRITLNIIPTSILKWRITDLILLVVLIFTFFIVYNDKPFHRQFYLDDKTIQHPFAERETVNTAELFIYSTWIPLVITFAVSLVLTTTKYKVYNTYVACLGLILSVLITSITTDILKNWIGRLRPDFLERCIPKEGTPLDKLVSIEVCTNEDLGMLEDGFRTTPSGHSSISFAGLTYLALFLIGQLQATNTWCGSWRFLIGGFAPMLMASFIALSRTQDYRHHFIDVFVGSLLGFSIGCWSYFRLFPWVGDSQSYYNKILIEEEKKIENKEANTDAFVVDGDENSDYTRLTNV
ncbi:DPP1 [Candida pseudojiufengensis]|uniref:DPP1 n=1 Tax=Candida pseudojiufengensis TaxID=497109 RepID=UPI002224D092|nr:DPP1 [Candida pseudojiufengensis]KAI5960776.1 DPP1 [Candida pseudojiufengensis]